MKKEKIHIIGIGGSARAPLAIMLKNLGYIVSGSDLNVYEPALSLLNKYDIDWYEGFKPEKIKDVDLVIISGSMPMENNVNTEFEEAKKLKKQIESFTYLVDRHIVKEESIVVCGTYGKTTISSLIAHILDVAGLNPSFLIGGLPLNFETGIRSTNSKYSVIEGDEYTAVSHKDFKMSPKFLDYSPKHTIITAAKWDHVDMYPTEDDYKNAYKELVKLVEKNKGTLYLSSTGENNSEIINQYMGKKKTYGFHNSDWFVNNILFEKEKTKFCVNLKNKKIGDFETEIFGMHNIENCLAAISLTFELGIELNKIQEGLKSYKGVKRRLEIVGKNKNGAIVIDDFGHSPIKAQSTLEALRTRYKRNKIICIYSPRISERDSKKTVNWYSNSFDQADYILIPKITVKKSTKKEERIHGIDIIDAINKDDDKKLYFPKNEQIIDFLNKESDSNTVIVFMSAGGWGDLIQKIIT